MSDQAAKLKELQADVAMLKRQLAATGKVVSDLVAQLELSFSMKLGGSVTFSAFLVSRLIEAGALDRDHLITHLEAITAEPVSGEMDERLNYFAKEVLNVLKETVAIARSKKMAN